jgi:ATP-dependent exoDNAse (exonuclease V) beta subunit
MSLVVYKSSAGSGKTTTLVNEYLSLALKYPDRFGSIIALTFTIKATTEMKERVFNVLDRIIHLENYKDDKGLQSGLKHIMEATGFDESKIRIQAKVLLHNILHQYSDFAFSTIDSFVVRIVRSFAHDLNLSMDFNIELETDLLIEQAIAMLFEKIGKDKQLTNFLIKYILQNVENEKTLHIENDLAELGKIIFESRHYTSIEKLKKMDLSVFETVNQKLKKDISEFEKKTAVLAQKTLDLIHSNHIDDSSFSRSTLPKQLRNIVSGSIDTEHKIFNNSEENQFYPKKAIQEQKDKIDRVRNDLVSLLQDIKALFDSDGKAYHNNRLILEKINPLALLTEIKLLLDQYSEENNIIHLSESNKRISDIVQNEHIPFIYERVGRKYNHFLVDEFQDTSVIQWNNLLPLIDNSLSSNNFNMLVGDAKQSIYRWRDGDVDQFIDLPTVKGANKSAIIKERENNLKNHIQEKYLTFNYRSEMNIIEFNNTFFKYLLENTHSLDKNGKKLLRYFDSERIKKVYADFEQSKGKTEDNGLVIIHNIPKNDESHFEKEVIAHINRLKKQNYRLQDIAILARTSKILHRMADILVQNNINIVSSETLYLINNPQVRLLVSIISYIGMQNRKNNLLNIVHILSRKHIKKGTSLLHNIKSYIDKIGKDDDYALLIEILSKFDYQVTKNKLQELQTYDLAEYLISSLHLNQTPNPFIQSLLNNILENAQNKGAGINAFLDFWESKKDKISINLPGDLDAIKLLTIHKAKGLEFPVVIFPANGFTSPRNDFHWIDPKKANIDLLDIAMVNHKSEMEFSSFNNSYVDENDKRNLDDLNLIYVANTRPTEQLIILFDENKSGSLWNRFSDFKNVSHSKIRLIDDNRIEFGQINKTHQSQHFIDDNTLKQLLSTDWHNKLHLKKSSQLGLDNERKDKIEKGKILHYLLSQIKTNKQINEVVQKAVLQGIITSSEQNIYSDKLLRIISHPAIRTFFKEDNIELNENTILLSSGEQKRPDKVILLPNETIIIDYKLSNWDRISKNEQNKHKKQLNDYRNLLQSMKYPNVKTHLIYIEDNIKLIEVDEI